MLERLNIKSVVCDSVVLNGGINYLMFSDDDDREKEKVNSVAESALVKWIFTDPFRSIDYLFYKELGIGEQYKPFFDVGDPIIKDDSGPGDIDLLLVDPNRPNKAIAFQVKRIKAEISEANQAALKINNIGKGISQTRYMHEKYRFFKSYLMLIIVADTKNRKSRGQMFRYLRPDEKDVVYEHEGFGDLPEEAGIYIFEINQPSV